MARAPRPLPVCCAALAVLCLGTAAPASAQVVQVTAAEALATTAAEPARLTQPTISLADAVTLSIRHNPAIAESAEALRGATGRHQQTRGLFDPTVRFLPSVSFDLKEMAPFLKAREINKRETIRIIASNFTLLSQALRQMIDASSPVVPRCPSGLQLPNGQLDLTGADLDLAGRDETELALLGVDTALQSVVVELGEGLDIDISSICRSEPREVISPEYLMGAFRRIDQAGGLGLQGILTSVSQIPLETRILQEDITRTVAQRALLALDRLGPLAEDELKRNITLDVNLSKMFRSGLQVTGDFQMQSQEHNFVDKPLDPTFGGLETPPQFFSSASGTLTVPLGRGRGTAATAASETAASRIAEGEREQFRHDVAEEVFRTVLSYLDLVAAQETVTRLEESGSRQQQILSLSQARVNAGELAQADLARVRASVAAIAGSLAQARTALVSARVALAEQMGVRVDDLQGAPLAAQRFASTITTADDVNRLIAQALSSRRDLRAAAARRDAAAALAAGARANARPRLDLTLTGGLYNLYDSPFFKFLPDEREPIISVTSGLPTQPVTGTPVAPLDPARYFSPVGYGRALKGRHTPFATVAVTFELPFGNRTARGRAAQAEASLNSSAIQSENLRRVIGENIVELTETLRRAADSLAEWEAAVARGAETLDGRIRMFQVGDATLIDALLTEDGLTGDHLQLVRQRQAYLSALARLKLELGELVVVDGADASAETMRFDAGAFTAQ
ncbi:MAG: TolC family protein [Acidobacteria bacterium]|nr:TolC family protein [Acidobacteriota bacterium]